METTKIVVKSDKDDKNILPILAATIRKLSDNLEEILNSGMNHKSIIVLLSDSTKLSKRTIQKVMEGIHQLRSDYCNG